MPQAFDARKSVRPFDQSRSLVAAIEMSQENWLVGGMVPGLQRCPLKKLSPDKDKLLALLLRWRDEALRTGHEIDRIAVACESGRDGFWLVRWLRAQGVEAHVIHAASVAVSREHRRAKTDRLDIEMLKRALLGWLRGEVGHCSMVTIPSSEEEDAKRPSRERETLVGERTRLVNAMKADLARLGIRNFNPGRRKAAEQVEVLQTAEGTAIPPNTLAKLRRDMEDRVRALASDPAVPTRHSRRPILLASRQTVFCCLALKVRGRLDKLRSVHVVERVDVDHAILGSPDRAGHDRYDATDEADMKVGGFRSEPILCHLGVVGDPQIEVAIWM